jgi:hypothetical protein
MISSCRGRYVPWQGAKRHEWGRIGVVRCRVAPCRGMHRQRRVGFIPHRGHVSIHPGHWAASGDDDVSVRPGHPDPAGGQGVWQVGQERLVGRVASAEGVERDPTGIEVELGTDEALLPIAIDVVQAAEHIDPAGDRRPADEDDPSARRSRPPWREVEPGPIWGRFDPHRAPTAVGPDVTVGHLDQAGQIETERALPDARLPETVERFDRGLEAMLTDRREDRDDPEREAQSWDRAQPRTSGWPWVPRNRVSLSNCA